MNISTIINDLKNSGALPWIYAVGALLVGAAFLGLLQLIPGRFRKLFIALVTFLAGLIYSVEYFWPANPATDKNFLTGFTEQVDVITTVVFTFAMGLGVINLVQLHGKNIFKRKPNWPYSLGFFIAFFALMIGGFLKDYLPSKITKNLFDMLFQGTIVSLGASMFSTVAFFIVSAAYRAFRIKSAEATLMLIAAFIVMLGQVPVGAAITNFIPATGFLSNLRLENTSYWILTVPNMAAWRGISFGIEIGALAMSLRIWLSLEKGSFFDQEL